LKLTLRAVCTVIVVVAFAAFFIHGYAYTARAQAPVWMTQEPHGSITGAVIDKDGLGFPNALVTLYQNGAIYPIQYYGHNPLLTNNDTAWGEVGHYNFFVPYGQYTITASQADASGNYHNTTVNVTLNTGTVTADIVIVGYPKHRDVFPTPTPTIMPTATPPAQSPIPTPAGHEWLVLSGIAIGIVILALKKRTD
jgi:hypothetical protein